MTSWGCRADGRGRCSEYRGSTVPFSSCLNLTTPQFAVGQQNGPAPVGQAQPFKPRLGPQPVVQMNNYKPAQAAPARQHQQLGQPGPGMTIMSNPTRSNGLQHSKPSGTSTSNGYGNAAKGVRPPPGPVVDERDHRGKLQSLLTGHSKGGIGYKGPNGNTARSPPSNTFSLPTSNGHHSAENGLGRGSAARGRGGPRGRGSATRGRGEITGIPMAF
jgi:5'-3' exoribonuclease 1